jgi:hypothetical protein
MRLIDSRSFAGDRNSKVKWGEYARRILGKLSLDDDGEDDGEVTSSKPACLFLVEFGGSIFELLSRNVYKSRAEADTNEFTNLGLRSAAGESK